MLQYDNSAFYFFCLSTISFYLLPSWYGIISRVYNAYKTDEKTVGAVARTSAEQKKVEQIKRETKLQTLKSKGFLINLGITIFFTIIFIWLAVTVSTDGEVNSFDPFAILEIDHGADARTIKKAYRQLSLLYHPDKNPGNRVAEAKFMMVSKAYEALTDETARENWEKYGNPDGKQSLEVSIGLPSFLLDTANRNLVLVAYLIIMVVLIPFGVWTYYSDSSKYGEKDVMYDTYAWFHHMLSEHVSAKQLPEVLAGAAEFRKRGPDSPEEKQRISKIMNEIKSHMGKPKFNHPICVKGNVLIHAHLLRKTDMLDQKLQDDLKYMLRYSTSLIDAMISVCKHQDWIQTAIQCIEFGQYMTQAMWTKDSPLLQIPQFGPEEIAHVEKGKNPVRTVKAYRALPDDHKKGMNDLTDQQKKDVMNYLKKIYPDITVECKVFVDDDEDDRVYEGDLCTVQVTITRNNLEDGEKVGPVHAPKFPFPKKEAYWIILGQLNQGKIISIEKVGNPQKKIEHKIKFLAPPKGTYEFDLLVKSNAYVGVDEKLKVDLETLDNSVLPEYKVHPDDAVLDDEPTLFEEILNANVDKGDSDDEQSDEEEEEKPTSSASAKKREQLRKARQGGDDDSDDDDDDAEEVYADK